VTVYGVYLRVRCRLVAVTGGVKDHRGLTTERVVDAALRAADQKGIDARTAVLSRSGMAVSLERCVLILISYSSVVLVVCAPS
jgi:hypothetical protein